MTAHYPESHAGGSAPDPLSLGHELSALIRDGITPENAASIRQLVYALTLAEGRQPADVLPLLKLASELLSHCAAAMPAPIEGETDYRHLIALCGALATRATMTVETATGLPADGFFGGVELRN